MNTLQYRPAAFTLIELIVTISIIAMLGTLLFPVATTVIERTRQSKCAHNLRQLGMIIQTAATENDGTFPAIENDPKNPIHTPEDGRVWTLPELVTKHGASVDILKCPADLAAELCFPKDGKPATSYYEAKGSSYEWYPFFEGESTFAPKRLGRGGARTLPSGRVRLLMDYAENGEAPHSRTAEGSSMHTLFADGSVRTVTLTKEQ